MKCILPRSRAIDDDEKALRRQSILDAASRLFLARPGTLPSVIAIAQEAGLAKGTVYLYFKTKEEIFISLLATHYETLVGLLVQLTLSYSNNLSHSNGLSLSNDSSHASNLSHPDNSEQLIPALVDQVIDFTNQHPDFMHLATMANSVLEQNTEVSIVLEFKSMLVERLSALAGNLATLTTLSENRCKDLLIHTNAMILGLWQMQNLPSDVAEAIKERHYEILMPDFAPTLRDAMTLLWQGAMKQA
ncbi:TetR family transcriptional regulator [Hahella sp. CCB-MM4]|uniref:TetR family transcriptional regulator n=1 Tax=Hahella sp. (strain CCB-MM4) TaxID=1926491 RepID=UPI000B9B5A13|nr:TetR family transcriptional regulator [Hahella sp. CCB-MM4]OZG70672.1 TetR family transcriptional regulator [Hahella sp. CCB-MM4]